MQATNSGLHTGKPVLNFNNSNTMNFTDACRRHRDQHDCNWWRNHCHTIILIGGGFYAWDLGYWYPAYGYDSYNSNYSYDGPIYGYNGLPPDQIIANVQYVLQQLGYFAESVDGVLGPVTQQAIADYQVDNSLTGDWRDRSADAGCAWVCRLRGRTPTHLASLKAAPQGCAVREDAAPRASPYQKIHREPNLVGRDSRRTWPRVFGRTTSLQLPRLN